MTCAVVPSSEQAGTVANQGFQEALGAEASPRLFGVFVNWGNVYGTPRACTVNLRLRHTSRLSSPYAKQGTRTATNRITRTLPQRIPRRRAICRHPQRRHRLLLRPEALMRHDSHEAFS
jgi:hypothetical protein